MSLSSLVGLVLSPVGTPGFMGPVFGGPKDEKNVEHRIGQSFLCARGDIQRWSAGLRFGLPGLKWSPFGRVGLSWSPFWSVGLVLSPLWEQWGDRGNRAFDANWMKHVEQQIGQ